MSAAPEAKRGRGRSPGFVMSDAHRLKIQKSNILTALIGHAEGKREMSATQVQAGLGLLKKCLPDLSAVEHTGVDGGPIEIRATKEQRDAAVSAALRSTDT